ncbi:hypothetical protein ACE41H_04730 [Paenibacillus enshidis]|uniref:Uncharacterized protein n=1 Tax=Paenibacillus enshidis TaxID=1458439 RepID=A0ABV5APF5_9BACL
MTMTGSKTEAERMESESGLKKEGMPDVYVLAEHRPEMEISQQNSCRFPFIMPEDGFAELDLTARSDSDWSEPDRESAIVRVYMGEQYNQDVILFYGSSSFTYTRLLGHLTAGEYEVEIAFRAEASSPKVERAWIDAVQVRIVPDSSPQALVYRHTPLLYGRCLSHPYENRFTDTPLMMFYSVDEREDKTVIEYQMMFSHEDEGTPAPFLMSKWGRTTDIEWMYRIELDAAGNTVTAEFQGEHHITTSFGGGYDLGGHPVLQTATANGNITDRITADYRFMLSPAFQWKPEQEPREAVMMKHPFAFQVTNWEMKRQEPLELPPAPPSIALADQRYYVFVQLFKQPLPADVAELEGLPKRGFNRREEDGCVDIQVRLKGSDEWYSSCYHDLHADGFRAAYEGAEAHFSTTIKLPCLAVLEDIVEIKAVLLEGGADRMRVGELRAFVLDEHYRPAADEIRSPAMRLLTRHQPVSVLWTAGESGAV